MKIVIDDHYNGIILKSLLRSKLGFSAAAVTALKQKPLGITVNGEHATVRRVLMSGDLLELQIEDSEPSRKIKPNNLPIDIVFEDDFILAVNKPPFLPVHPSKKLQDDTLAGRVLGYINPFVFRCATRLDKDTSGIVLIAKDMLTARRLTDMHASRIIDKSYIAVVCGEGSLPSNGRIDLNIRRKPPSFVEREVIESELSGSENDPCGVEAHTCFEIFASQPPYYLLRVFPITGRTHQLRVHFSGVGFPIVGDTLYGGTSSLIARQALHAARLRFSHPENGESMSLIAELPDDMKKLIFEIFGKELDVKDIYEEKT